MYRLLPVALHVSYQKMRLAQQDKYIQLRLTLIDSRHRHIRRLQGLLRQILSCYFVEKTWARSDRNCVSRYSATTKGVRACLEISKDDHRRRANFGSLSRRLMICPRMQSGSFLEAGDHHQGVVAYAANCAQRPCLHPQAMYDESRLQMRYNDSRSYLTPPSYGI